MKTKANKYLIGFTVTLMSLFASGCRDNIIEGGMDDGPVSPPPVADEQLFMALRIYNASDVDASPSSRAGEFDPVPGDYEQDDKYYNIGLDDENALYPSSSPDDSPHFLLVFGEDVASNTTNRNKLEFLMPLFEWSGPADKDNSSTDHNSTSGYKGYTTFYTSAKKTEVPQSFANRKVLAVLNANAALKSKLQSALFSKADYSTVTGYTVGDNNSDNADYLFLISGNRRYFTMTSSMVVYNKTDNATTTTYHGPSNFLRSNAWKETKEEAQKYPAISLFLERMQSKYTLTFSDKNGKKCYFGAADDAGTVPDGYNRVQHFIVSTSSSDATANLLLTPTSQWSTLKYVNSYTARANTSNFETNFINTTTNWKINVTGWNINAIEKTENLFKNINPSGSYYTGWNNPAATIAQYRNFWAVDPNYSTTSYPDQYRPIQSVITVKDNEGTENETTRLVIQTDETKAWSSSNTLKYYGYSDLAKRNVHQYAPENTFDMNVFNGFTSLADAYSQRAHLRVSSHIIITAQLLVQGFDDSDVFSADYFDTTTGLASNSSGTASAKSKLLMNDIFWTPAAYLEYVQEYLGFWMKDNSSLFGNNNGIFYVKTVVEDQDVYRPAKGSDFIMTAANVKGGDGWVRIIPDYASLVADYDADTFDKTEVVLYNYNPADDSYTGISANDFDLLALTRPEYFAQHFNMGRMYYAVPVVHNTASTADLETGKYGNVRNHWYSLNVASFSSIGNPVDNPAQLIIPNNERSFETLGITISVLPWHKFETDVDISQQRPPLSPESIDMDIEFKAEDWEHGGWIDEDF